MDSIKNSANFGLCFIYFYEQYAWFTDEKLSAVNAVIPVKHNELNKGGKSICKYDKPWSSS